MGWMAPLRHLSAKLLSDRISSEWEPSMGEVTYNLMKDLGERVSTLEKELERLRH